MDSVRSRFLTHWAGRWNGQYLDRNIEKLTDVSRKLYIELLMSLLREGFWMTIPKERLRGFNDTPKGINFEYEAYMTCFTELRPTQAKNHCKNYGLLGIVVDRAFALKRRGGPVHYVRSHRDDAVVGNFVSTIRWIKEQAEEKSKLVKGLCEDLKQCSDEQEKARKDAEDAGIVFGNLLFQSAFMKGMSDPGKDNYKYLDEHEWRIVHSDRIEKKGGIVRTGVDLPKYRIPIVPNDIVMLVLPDKKVREQVIQNAEIQEWFDGRMAQMITVEELQHL